MINIEKLDNDVRLYNIKLNQKLNIGLLKITGIDIPEISYKQFDNSINYTIKFCYRRDTSNVYFMERAKWLYLKENNESTSADNLSFYNGFNCLTLTLYDYYTLIKKDLITQKTLRHMCLLKPKFMQQLLESGIFHQINKNKNSKYHDIFLYIRHMLVSLNVVTKLYIL